MKGFMIYEDYRGKKVVEAVKLGVVNYTTSSSDGDWVSELSGIRNSSTQAYCNKEDTYDFEVGALIALMKMCGFDKSYKAIEEAFKYNSYDAKKSKVYEEKIHTLEKEKEQIIVAKNILYNNLEEENECLEEEKKHLKDKYERCQHILQSRTKDIHRLENEVIDLKTQICLMAKKEADFIDKNKELHKNIDELFESDKHAKSEVARLSFKNHRLEEENKMLCDKIKFLDKENRNLIYGGRQNGKQYTFLVDLFKKIPQNKVDEAYKEAYNTKLPLWQKEFLNQMYGIYKESKEKIELPGTLDINGTTYRKSIQIKGFNIKIKPPTKREEMWDEIFALHKESDVVIKVKREDVNAFLHEIEKRIPEITWASTVKIFETKYTIGDIYEELKTCDTIYFRLSKENTLTYSSDSHIYPYREIKSIDYLPPMRWDLFKKGRIVVGVRKEHYDEFKKEITRQFGLTNQHKPYENFNYSFYMHYKNVNFIEAVGRSQFRQPTMINNHKVVYWEDVR